MGVGVPEEGKQIEAEVEEFKRENSMCRDEVLEKNVLYLEIISCDPF